MTVGPGITPDLLTLFLTTQPNRRSRADPAHRAMNRFYRRWGIAPRPEDVLTTGDSGTAIIRSSTVFRAWRDRPRRRFARWNASRGARFIDDCARIRGRRTRYEMRAGRRALLLFLALISWSPFSVQVSVLLFKTLLPRNTTAVGRQSTCTVSISGKAAFAAHYIHVLQDVAGWQCKSGWAAASTLTAAANRRSTRQARPWRGTRPCCDEEYDRTKLNN